MLHDRDAEPGKLVERVRGDAVAAALVPRVVGPVQQQHPRVRAGAQRTERSRGAGRSRADDDEVPHALQPGRHLDSGQ